MRFGPSVLATGMGALLAALLAGCSSVPPGPVAGAANVSSASAGVLFGLKDLPSSSADWTLTKCKVLVHGVCKLFVEVGATGLPPTLPAADQNCQLTVSSYATTQLKQGQILRWTIVGTADGYKFRFATPNGVVLKENNNIDPGLPRPVNPPPPALFQESQTADTADKMALADVVDKPFIYTILLQWQPPKETKLWGNCIPLDPLIVNSN